MRRSEQGFTLIEIMVVLAIIATLVAAVSLGIPLVQKRSAKLQCQRNLKELGTAYMSYKSENPGRPKYSGTALFLYFVQKKMITDKQVDVLLCPGDESAVHPKSDADRAKYGELDLTNPSGFKDMCSYAVRDFAKYPLKHDTGKSQIIACDRQGPDSATMHHDDGLVVLFDDGRSMFMDREALDLSPGSEVPIKVGPEAEHELLKQVVYIPDSKE